MASTLTLAFWLLAFVMMVEFKVAFGCSPTDDPEDVSGLTAQDMLNRMCPSDLTFRGVVTSTVSRTVGDTIFTSTTFQVNEYFRDTTETQAPTVTINVDYMVAFQCCRAEPFNLTHEILVFASHFGNALSFPCTGYPVWSDVPPAFINAARNLNPCVNGGVISLTETPVPPPTDPPTMPNNNTGTPPAPLTTASNALPQVTVTRVVTESMCPVHEQDGLAIDAEVDLTGVDSNRISPVADFMFVSMMCRVQLDPCPTPPVRGPCYCVQQAGAIYTVRYAGTTDVALSNTQVKVTVPNSNDTMAVAQSDPATYPRVKAQIVETLRTSDRSFSLRNQLPVVDISGLADVTVMWYDVTGLTAPYQITVKVIPDGPNVTVINQSTLSMNVDLNYDGVTLSYAETDVNDACARTDSRTYTFGAAMRTSSSFSALTLVVLALATVFHGVQA